MFTTLKIHKLLEILLDSSLLKGIIPRTSRVKQLVFYMADGQKVTLHVDQIEMVELHEEPDIEAITLEMTGKTQAELVHDMAATSERLGGLTHPVSEPERQRRERVADPDYQQLGNLETADPTRPASDRVVRPSQDPPEGKIPQRS